MALGVNPSATLAVLSLRFEFNSQHWARSEPVNLVNV
jgi:hypothetical protein